ncbi:hypothetical protein [Photobacterium kasasachensis]|uniref:hypothetical protein n=1 Tax=Photobacterium kasasachensis TaxID=2910240 RepID=UPI003D0DC85D
MQEFKVSKKLITFMKGGLVLSLAFTALGFILPFLPDEQVGGKDNVIITSVLCVVFFGSLSILAWLLLRKIPYVDIVIDDDGIWYKHLGKQRGLILWQEISKIKERELSQCLYLLDYNGTKLLRVEYQLIGFEDLRYIISEKVYTKSSELDFSKCTKSTNYHLFNFIIVIFFSTLGLYVGADGNYLLGYGGVSIVVIITIYDYIVTATGVEINNGYIEVFYPLGNKSISFSDITGVHIVDEFQNGNRIPEVWVLTRLSKKPFKLKKLGVDSNRLFAAIRKVAQLP